MGFLSEKRVAKLGNHTIEVRGQNHILRGHLFWLFFDGQEVANAQNFWKIPTQRRLEAKVSVEGAERHLVLLVKQHWLWTEYVLTVDGEPLALELVNQPV